MQTSQRAVGRSGRVRGGRPAPARSSFSRSRPKAAKRTAGRTTAAEQIPAFIRAEGTELDKDDRALLRRKLGMRLGKFAPAIERVSVRVADVNGPRGGVDKACRIKVVLTGLPSVIVDERDAAARVAIDRALSGVGRAVRKTLQRRQTKPLRRRT
jgi:hypothetical protein